MFTILDTHRSPAILSVKLRAARTRLALVVTPSPALARAVGEYLQETDNTLSVVWMPTMAAACRRLESIRADRIVVDARIPDAEDAIDALHTAAPEACVQVLAKDA